MNIKLKAQTVVVSVLATALVGCFEPNGKNFEGAWVNSKKNDVVKPTLLDITCEKGFCEVSKTIWFFPTASYADPSISHAKLENDNLLVWDGFQGSAKVEGGKLIWNSDIYVRRE
ncbi:TPA: hypothetical protein ACPH2S_005707 [Pseudomonas aeruginosa]|uniref:hypothetical protein n=1 Tax=Pseudomonas aeruginosa TaxID=287 RepID=UPI0029503F04|nr:hypothetical protein [Pseudomonas aeruginosa]EKX9015140.1 hypothetical protein [Pseudomonas aeruginosa]EKY0764116.1 hypothetical protein [Pseudomonas aeruginosa]ELY0897727.1 hypothetical protein [Pseudomonas aeruginosa]MCO2426261.1 hypothetical protein [Pseudomonas aeruginosa]